MASGEDWEEKLIEQLVEMFRNMGMNMDKEQIRGMMEQFRSQFENMGLDAEKIAKGDVNFNFDLSHLAKMFQSGKSMEDILSNLGMDRSSRCQPSPRLKHQRSMSQTTSLTFQRTMFTIEGCEHGSDGRLHLTWRSGAKRT